MAQTKYTHVQNVTITKKRVNTLRDEVEYQKVVEKDGKYVLPWDTTNQQPNMLKNIRYSITMDRTNVPSEEELNKEPLMELMLADPKRLEESPQLGIRITWLGHASALFQLDCANIIVNPNFNNHAGSFAKRYRPSVYKIEDLPRIDLAFITNTHFDYLDIGSIRSMNERFGEMLLWYVPMGLRDWMLKLGCVNVEEMDWWEEDEIDFLDQTVSTDDSVTKQETMTFKIVCTPSQSAHTRTLDINNAVLWCSWAIISPRYKLFISGATGYNDMIFKSIGYRYGPFHMAALPIGRYSPDWKFAFGNATPEQAVQIQQDVLALCSVALSWGTLTVSNEYYLEPPKRLEAELEKRGFSKTLFFLLRHGESRLLNIEKVDKKHEPNGDLHR